MSLPGVAGSGWTRPGDGATIREPQARGWRRLCVQIFRLPMTQVTHSVRGTKPGVCHRRRSVGSTLDALRIRLHFVVLAVQSIRR